MVITKPTILNINVGFIYLAIIFLSVHYVSEKFLYSKEENTNIFALVKFEF